MYKYWCLSKVFRVVHDNNEQPLRAVDINTNCDPDFKLLFLYLMFLKNTLNIIVYLLALKDLESHLQRLRCTLSF